MTAANVVALRSSPCEFPAQVGLGPVVNHMTTAGGASQSSTLSVTSSHPRQYVGSLEDIARIHYARLLDEDLHARATVCGQAQVRPAGEWRDQATANLRGNLLAAAPVLQLLADEFSYPLEPGSTEFLRGCKYLLRAEREAALRRLEEDRGDFSGKPTDPLFVDAPASANVAPPPPVAICDSPRLPAEPWSELHPNSALPPVPFMKVYLGEKGLEGKPALTYLAAAARLEEIAGARPVRDYTERDIVDYLDALHYLPARHARYGFRSAEQAVRVNRNLSESRQRGNKGAQPHEGLSPTTINSNYMLPLSLMFDYAVERHCAVKNVAAGKRSKKKPSHHRSERRDAFANKDIVHLFESPMYTGTSSPGRYHQPGTYQHNCWRFWLPLFMYLTGVRPHEFGQAEVADVLLDGHWPTLRITNEATTELDVDRDGTVKRVKTRAGKRMLPIHPILIGLGFLDHVEAMKAKDHHRIFPDWRLACDGTYSSTASHFFNQAKSGYLVKLGIKSDRLSLYSLRHTFKDNLRETGLPGDEQNFLMGHEGPGAGDIYGTRRLYKKLIEHYLALDLGDVTLDHVTPRMEVQPRRYEIGGMTWEFGTGQALFCRRPTTPPSA